MNITAIINNAKLIIMNDGMVTDYYHKLSNGKWLYVFPICSVYETCDDDEVLTHLREFELKSSYRDGYTIKWE